MHDAKPPFFYKRPTFVMTMANIAGAPSLKGFIQGIYPKKNLHFHYVGLGIPQGYSILEAPSLFFLAVRGGPGDEASSFCHSLTNTQARE